MRVPNLEEALWPDGSHPTTSSPRTTQDFRTCPHAEQVVYGIRYLAWARALAVGHTSRLGLPSERLEDLALAVGELATNSIRHGGYGLLVVNDLADLVHTHRAGRDGDPAALPRALVITDRVRRSSRNFFDRSRIGRDPLGIRWV